MATADIRKQNMDFLKQKSQDGFFGYFSGIGTITKSKRTG